MDSRFSLLHVGLLVASMAVCFGCGKSSNHPDMGRATAVQFSRDGRLLVAGYGSGKISLWTGDEYRKSERIGSPMAPIVALVISDDASRLYSVVYFNNKDERYSLVQQLSTSTLQVEHEWRLDDCMPIGACLGDDGKLIVASTYSIYVIGPDSPTVVWRSDLADSDAQINSIARVADSPVVVALSDGDVAVLDGESFNETGRIKPFSDECGVLAAFPSPDGSKLACCGGSNGLMTHAHLTLVNMQDQSMVNVKGETFTGVPSSVAFSGDGTVAVASSWDGQVVVFDATSGEVKYVVRRRIAKPWAVAMTEGGERFAVADSRGVQVFRTQDGSSLMRDDSVRGSRN